MRIRLKEPLIDGQHFGRDGAAVRQLLLSDNHHSGVGRCGSVPSGRRVIANGNDHGAAAVHVGFAQAASV